MPNQQPHSQGENNTLSAYSVVEISVEATWAIMPREML